eukprot:TRINITY_DN10359_c0_g1_i2.p1 TRINITY_DN10359_c0_g1~~TRINITY_DN10359_c0_g1_i2.p1  ORF type:complete len:247 (-),score=40.28 TRINITY_DN10359_c0_g1_i2:2-742(-)
MKCYILNSNEISISRLESNKPLHRPLQKRAPKFRLSPILKRANTDSKKFLVSLVPGRVKTEARNSSNPSPNKTAFALVTRERRISVKDVNSMAGEMKSVASVHRGAIGYLMPKRIRNTYSRRQLFDSNKHLVKSPSPEIPNPSTFLWKSHISLRQRNGGFQLYPATLNLYEEQGSSFANYSPTTRRVQEMKVRRKIVASTPKVDARRWYDIRPVSYTHLRAHETSLHLVCRLLLEKKKKKKERKKR